MGDKVIKLGVMGLKRGWGVASGALNDERVQIRAVCDQNTELHEKVRKAFKENGKDTSDLLFLTDYEELLKSDVDAIVLANFANEHVPFTVRALEAGKHVLSEVPAIYSIEEAKTLKEAVEAHPECKYMFGENCCYWAFIEAWKEMHENGKFGEIVYAESEYLHAGPPKNFKPLAEHWRNHISAIRYSTHNLGPLLYLMDDKVKTVSCMAPDPIYNPYKDGKQNGVALFKTEKGAVIRIFIGFGAYVGFDHNFRVVGTRGMAQTDANKPLDAARCYMRFEDIPGTYDEMTELPVGTAFVGESTVGHGGADVKMIADFITCIAEDKKPKLDIDLAIRMSLPGIIADESSKQGGALLEVPEI